MKAYCINCGSIQPSKFRPGQDAITNETYEDLCCDTCHFIVATIQDRESSQQPSQALELDLLEPEPVNVVLVELLEPAFTEIQHVLGSTLEVPYQRKSLETALGLVRAAIAVIKQSQPDYEAMHKKGFQAFDCPVCGFDGALGFQPAAQPSQAGELNDAKRLDWIRDQLFEHKWNGVVGKGCAVQWVVAPDFRFKQRELTDDSGIAAGDFRRAIDAAINAKGATP